MNKELNYTEYVYCVFHIETNARVSRWYSRKYDAEVQAAKTTSQSNGTYKVAEFQLHNGRIF